MAVFGGFFIVTPIRAVFKTHAIVEDKPVESACCAVIRMWPIAVFAVGMAGKAVLVFRVEVWRAFLHTLPLVQEKLVHTLYRGQKNNR